MPICKLGKELVTVELVEWFLVGLLEKYFLFSFILYIYLKTVKNILTTIPIYLKTEREREINYIPIIFKNF